MREGARRLHHLVSKTQRVHQPVTLIQHSQPSCVPMYHSFRTIVRGHPYPASQAVNAAWEWPRQHRIGWSVAATGHCNPRHKPPFTHHRDTKHWAAVPVHVLNVYHGPLLALNSVVTNGRTTYPPRQVTKVSLVTSIFSEGRWSKDMIDTCNLQNTHIRDACDSTPSASSIPESDS